MNEQQSSVLKEHAVLLDDQANFIDKQTNKIREQQFEIDKYKRLYESEYETHMFVHKLLEKERIKVKALLELVEAYRSYANAAPPPDFVEDAEDIYEQTIKR